MLRLARLARIGDQSLAGKGMPPPGSPYYTKGNYGDNPSPASLGQFFGGPRFKHQVIFSVFLALSATGYNAPLWTVPFWRPTMKKIWAINADESISIKRYGLGKNYCY